MTDQATPYNILLTIINLVAGSSARDPDFLIFKIIPPTAPQIPLRRPTSARVMPAPARNLAIRPRSTPAPKMAATVPTLIRLRIDKLVESAGSWRNNMTTSRSSGRQSKRYSLWNVNAKNVVGVNDCAERFGIGGEKLSCMAYMAYPMGVFTT